MRGERAKEWVGRRCWRWVFVPCPCPPRSLLHGLPPDDPFPTSAFCPPQLLPDQGTGMAELASGAAALTDFSVLLTDVPWDSRSVWSTMAAYLFSLHIPLSFGGLPTICQILNQSDLDPRTEAASLVVLQSLELAGALILLHYSAKRPYKISSFFQNQNKSEERNWTTAASFGLIFLLLVVLLTSLLANRLLGPKDVNNPQLKNILVSSPLSEVAIFSIYCFITPMLEEAVYRGFLLTCLSTTMNWQTAVVISASVFSLAHLSPENLLQLFFIGCVLGSTYCWSGNLISSFVIHAVYNAIILLTTISS